MPQQPCGRHVGGGDDVAAPQGTDGFTHSISRDYSPQERILFLRHLFTIEMSGGFRSEMMAA